MSSKHASWDNSKHVVISSSTRKLHKEIRSRTSSSSSSDRDLPLFFSRSNPKEEGDRLEVSVCRTLTIAHLLSTGL